MGKLVLRHFKYALAAGGGLALLLAVACGAPAAPSGATQPAAAVSNPQPTAPAAAAPQQPVATAAPAGQSAQSSAAERQTAPAPANILDRPTLKAGVIWLDSPFDPVLGGWVASQSGMSENLFRLSPTNFRPEPWLATEATHVDPLTWEIKLRSGVKFHNGAEMDAAAVKASLERTVRLSEASADTLGIDAIVVNDEHTITITTVEPRPHVAGPVDHSRPCHHRCRGGGRRRRGQFHRSGRSDGALYPHRVYPERTPQQRGQRQLLGRALRRWLALSTSPSLTPIAGSLPCRPATSTLRSTYPRRGPRPSMPTPICRAAPPASAPRRCCGGSILSVRPCPIRWCAGQ